MPTVTLPTGEKARFPEGTTPEQIDEVVRRDFPGFFKPQDPEFESVMDEVPIGTSADAGSPGGMGLLQRREDDALKRQLEQSLQLKEQGVDEITRLGGQKTTAEGMKQAMAPDTTGQLSDFMIDALNGPDPTGGWQLGDAIAGAAVGGAQRITGSGARWIGNKIGNETLEDWGRRGSEGGAARYNEYRHKDVDKSKMWQGDIATTVESVLEDLGPTLMMAAATGGLGTILSKIGLGTITGAVGAKLVTKIPGVSKWAWGAKKLPKLAFKMGELFPFALVKASTEAAMEGGGSFEDALYNGATEEEAHKIASTVFQGNMALGALDMLEVGLLFKAVPTTVKSRILKTIPSEVLQKMPARIFWGVAKLLGTAVMEGQQEVAQDEFVSWANGNGFDLSAVLNPVEGHEKNPEAFNMGALTSVGFSVPMMTLDAARAESKKNPQLATIFKKTRSELAAEEAAPEGGQEAPAAEATTPAEAAVPPSEPVAKPKELEGLEPLPEEEWDESNSALNLPDEELYTQAAHEVLGGQEGPAVLAYRQKLAQQGETATEPADQQEVQPDEADDYIDILADMERENGRTPTVAEAVDLGVPESVAKTLLEEESDQKLQLNQAQINKVAAEIAPSVVESGKIPTVAKLAKDRRIGAHASSPLEAQQLAKRVLDRIAIEAEQIIQDVDGVPGAGEAAALGADGDITDDIIKEEAEKLQQPSEEPSSPVETAGPEAEVEIKGSAPTPAKPTPKKMSEYTDKERVVIELAWNSGSRPRMGDVRRAVREQGLGTISQKEAQQLLTSVGDVGIEKGETAKSKTSKNVKAVHELATRLNKVPTAAEVLQHAPELIGLTEAEAKKLLNGPKNAPALVKAKQQASTLVSKATRERVAAQAEAKAQGQPDPFAAIPEENPYGIPAIDEKGKEAPQERAPNRDERRAEVEAAQESADPKRNEREARRAEKEIEAAEKAEEDAKAEAEAAKKAEAEAKAAQEEAERKLEEETRPAPSPEPEPDYVEAEDWADSPLIQDVVEERFKHEDVKEIIPTEDGAVVRLNDGYEIILKAVRDIEPTEAGVMNYGYRSLEHYNEERAAGRVYGAKGETNTSKPNQAIIYLNKGEVSEKDRADKSTIDHEAFHVLYGFAFSPKQKLQILKKVWSQAIKDAKKKGRTVTISAKEALADPTSEEAKFILNLAEEVAAEAYGTWHPSQRGLFTVLDNWLGRLIGSIQLDQIFMEIRAGNISIRVPQGATGDIRFQLRIPQAANAGFTQRANTTGSYIGAGQLVKEGEVVVDYGAGKGIGTEELKKSTKKVYSHEPFYDKEGDFTPDFSDPEGKDVLAALEGKADVVVNNLVLNVVPPAVRKTIVQNIGKLLKPGGRAYITTRSASDVNAAKSKKAAKLEEGGWIISPGTPRETYQKGFKQDELEQQVAKFLGKGFEVVKSDYGTKGNPQIEVRKLAVEPESEAVSKLQLTAVAQAELAAEQGEGPKFDAKLLDDPNFRRYWRKGVIVDEAGNPKILTHGTTDDSVANGREDWESFRDESGSNRTAFAPPDQLLGPHFAEYHGVANRFAGSEDINGPKTPPFGARVKTFTLAAQRVLDLRNDESGEFDQYAVASAMIDKVFTGGKNIDLVEKFLRKSFGHFATEAQIKEALAAYKAGKPIKNLVNPKSAPYESMAELIKSNDKFVRLDLEDRAEYIRRARAAFLRAGFDAIKYYNTAPGEVEGIAPKDRFAYISLKPSDVKSTANDGQYGQTGNYMHQLAFNPEQTNTAEFKRWFGNSAAVDGDGNPLVLLHGTTKDFDQFIPTKMSPGIFGLGIYMATLPKVSNTFTSEQATYQTPGGRTIPLYASIQNPVDMDAKLDPVVAATLPTLIEEIAAGYGITVSAQEIAAAIPDGATAGLAFIAMADVIAGSSLGSSMNTKRISRETVARAFQRSGYDGAKQVATDELGGHLDAETREALGIEAEFGEVWIAWAGSPQVKSALGNNGDFGVGEPKLAYQLGLPPNREQTESQNFKEWSQGEALLDEYGDPIVVGHGSTHTFSVFDTERGNKHNFFGRAIYASDSVDDIDANYLGSGADQLARIYERTDQLENEWEEMDPDDQRNILEEYADKDGYDPAEDGDDILAYAEAYDANMIYNALDRLSTEQILGENGGQPSIYPLYVRMGKPVYWGGPRPTEFEYEFGEYNEETEEYADEDPDTFGGEAGNFWRAINEVIDENYSDSLGPDGAREMTMDLLMHMQDYQSITPQKAMEILAPQTDNLYDDQGTMANTGWIIAQALRSMGYDGVIQDASRQFPGMPNITGAKHYIVFDPNQVKSALGNNGEFSRQNDDINYQLNISDMTPEQEALVNKARAMARDDADELREYDPTIPERDIARFEQRRLMSHLTEMGMGSNSALQLSFPKGDGRDGPGVELMDDWFEGKDFAFFKNSVEARKFQKRLKLLIGEKSRLTIFSAGMEDSGVYYGQKTELWDQAMHLYIDMKRDPTAATDPDILSKLTPQQKELLRMAQDIERANTDQLRGIKQIADDINASYAAHGIEAQDAGIISNILDNYVSRAWKLKDNKKLSRQDESGGFGTATRHARHRKLETILEGWALGHELLVKGATNNLMLLKNEIARVKEDRAIIHRGRRTRLANGDPKAPFLITHIVPKGYEDQYERIAHPNFIYRVQLKLYRA